MKKKDARKLLWQSGQRQQVALNQIALNRGEI
jgi:hypothetical protein